MKRKLSLLFLAIAIVFGNCKKKDPEVIYGVVPQDVHKPGANKPNPKSVNEFISIAHTDLFGTTIDQAELADMQQAYSSFGDKKLIEDMIVRNFLNDGNVDIPSDSEMRADVEKFVSDAYNKFFTRQPNEFELWRVAEIIEEDDDITPEMVYYAMLTSDEYRYY